MNTSTQIIPDNIMQLGFAFWGSKTLLSAVEMGLFTELAKGPMNVQEISERLTLHPRSAEDFLDALVSLGMLMRKENGLYANTSETDLFLDRNKPSYIGGLLEMGNARLYGFWGALTEALRTGKPQNEVKDGGNFFATLYSDHAKLHQFLEAMTGVSMGTAMAIAQKFPWGEYQTMVDVGCAQGALPVQVALNNNHVTGGGFDLPPVEPIFKNYVSSFNLDKRLDFHPGDFFNHPLPSADVLVMGHILHDWNLEEKRALIANAYKALPKDGSLVVYEALIDDERKQNAFGLLMSLNMLIETPGGFDYTGADCTGWMKDAGFREMRVEHLVGPDSMVVGIK